MRFDYIHNEMGIPHKLIAEQPSGLLSRVERIQQRHEFLRSLERAQYDPAKPGYISLTSLVSGTDIDFCRDIAKTPVTLYNKFLKTQ
jgi:mTERF domain-containing protein